MEQLPYVKKLENRTILIKVDAKPTTSFGKNPSDRTVEELLETGIININKPKGPTSHEVSEFIKKISGAKKAGQSGTLDPSVTGVLPVGLNKATRALQCLLNAGKEYVCLMHIHDPKSEKQILKVFKKFTGSIEQLPPIKSAVKREWRWRKIYYINLLEISDNKQDVLFKVGCEAGTYIRKLCSDMGDEFGCGAHMAQLVRTQVGQFVSENMSTIQDFKDNFYLYKNSSNDLIKLKAEEKLKQIIFPMEKIVEHIPKIWIFDSVVPYLLNGSDLAIPGISKLSSDIEPDQLIAVMTLKDELVGIGKAKLSSKVILENSKGIAVKFEKVLMGQDIYKKI